MRWRQKLGVNFADYFIYASAFLLGAASLVGIITTLSHIGSHYPYSYNEGWNAYYQTAAVHGGQVYPPASSYMVNNYPPLSFYIIGGLGLLTHSMVLAGRIVDLASLLVVIMGIYLFARHAEVRHAAALLAGGLFCAELMLFTSYGGMDEPQMLAQAFAILGGLAMIYLNRSRPLTILLAALCFALAFFTKHMVISLPLAIAIYLLFKREYRNLLLLIVFGFVLFDIGLVVCKLALHVNLLHQLHSARIYRLSYIPHVLWRESPLLAVPTLCLVTLLVRAWRRRLPAEHWPYVMYAVVALITGMVFAGGDGVNINAFFDAFIALAVCVALCLEAWQPRYLRALLAVAICLLVIGFGWPKFYQKWSNRNHNARDAKADIAFISAQGQTALCETLPLCYWANEPPMVDTFNVGEEFFTGKRSDSQLASLIRSKRFSSIQLQADVVNLEGPDLTSAITASYKIDHADGLGTFLVPR